MAKLDDINIRIVVDGRELLPTRLNKYGDTIEVEAETHSKPGVINDPIAATAEPDRGEVRVVVDGQDVGRFGSPLGGPQEAATPPADAAGGPGSRVERNRARYVDQECVGFAEPEENGLRRALREQLQREERLLATLGEHEETIDTLRTEVKDIRKALYEAQARVRTEETRLRIIRSAMGPNVLPD